ncbi:MAG: terminase large subunit domain-containing protein, partial [Bryobacteraceae bacterium]
KQNFGFTADPLQAQIMTDDSGQTLVLGARQTGKSTAAALKVLHTAIQNPGQIILLAAPSNRQSGYILDTARAAAMQIYGQKAKPIAEGFELPNQTQVIGLPDSEPTIRGYSNPFLIVVDEAAFVDDNIYKALLPAQASGRTNLLVMSTPNGQQGFFYEQWENQSADWTRIKIDVSDCPRITPEFLSRARLTLGHESFSQEFQCKFLLAPGAIFTREMVLQCIKPNVESLFPWDEQVMQ